VTGDAVCYAVGGQDACGPAFRYRVERVARERLGQLFNDYDRIIHG
jgi:hypothetical protein